MCGGAGEELWYLWVYRRRRQKEQRSGGGKVWGHISVSGCLIGYSSSCLEVSLTNMDLGLSYEICTCFSSPQGEPLKILEFRGELVRQCLLKLIKDKVMHRIIKSVRH